MMDNSQNGIYVQARARILNRMGKRQKNLKSKINSYKRLPSLNEKEMII